MIGPGMAFDTNKYFIICSNVLGSCKGTTGPSSVNPKTGKKFGLDFPIISVSDMVNVQKHLIDHFGIDQLLSVAGGSMGGMQALEWLTAYPDKLRSAIVIATAVKHSPQQIAFHEVGRQAIMADHPGNGKPFCWRKSTIIITFSPVRVCHDRLSANLVKGNLLGRMFHSSCNNNGVFQLIRISGEPLQGLHSAHRTACH